MTTVPNPLADAFVDLAAAWATGTAVGSGPLNTSCQWLSFSRTGFFTSFSLWRNPCGSSAAEAMANTTAKRKKKPVVKKKPRRSAMAAPTLESLQDSEVKPPCLILLKRKGEGTPVAAK
ncbi:hypothetical protein MUK42_33299 [Musa troglodytarum]|uniref:Uncharacterized protein n=1 Tax=Musa troglodytarum TaxID=320322 RepID=A0A9E7I9F8_9LILI|nr:hypothetical protein MUK42_33299 [Musa troglodytarum]